MVLHNVNRFIDCTFCICVLDFLRVVTTRSLSLIIVTSVILVLPNSVSYYICSQITFGIYILFLGHIIINSYLLVVLIGNLQFSINSFRVRITSSSNMSKEGSLYRYGE